MTLQRRNINDGYWGPLFDETGNWLPGIYGKNATRAAKADGTHIGADFVRMAPNTAFPFHTHVGDHELYILIGRVKVFAGDAAVEARLGDVLHIAADQPHCVTNPYEEEAIFLAVGHPHIEVHSHNRMTLVDVETAGEPSSATA